MSKPVIVNLPRMEITWDDGLITPFQYIDWLRKDGKNLSDWHEEAQARGRLNYDRVIVTHGNGGRFDNAYRYYFGGPSDTAVLSFLAESWADL